MTRLLAGVLILGATRLLLAKDPASGPAPPAILWQAPPPMTVRDWICGPGGCGRTPAPPFRFLREDLTESTPKVLVRDAHGLTWSVKFGAKPIPECFSSRFVTAVGYIAEPTYCVAAGSIVDAHGLRRAGRFIKNGRFTKARFELRGQSDLVFLEGHTWAWDDNPFLGTHELAGLKIVMMLLSNWDAKDAREGHDTNTGVFQRPGRRGPELLYSVFDWGSTLGRWGTVLRRDQSDCSGYVRDSAGFIRSVQDGAIQWGYWGKHGADLTTGISLDDVRWLMPYLERITPQEIQAGLQASGATPRQTACWAWGMENRVAQLKAIAN